MRISDWSSDVCSSDLCVELAGYEADDLIATYARQAKAAGAEVTVVSSDKDLMQLVDGGITMLDPIKERKIGRDEVVEKFGVQPERVVDVQALARSEEHTSELQSLMRISYAVLCLKKKNNTNSTNQK